MLIQHLPTHTERDAWHWNIYYAVCLLYTPSSDLQTDRSHTQQLLDKREIVLRLALSANSAAAAAAHSRNDPIWLALRVPQGP